MISGELEQCLVAAVGTEFVVRGAVPGSGGSFGQTWKLDTSSGPLFLKQVAPARFPMLEAEARGLQELAACRCVQVPEVVASGQSAHDAFLLLTYLDLRPLETGSARVLGHQLADLHAHCADRFGWQHDNFIGAAPQPNRPDPDWVGFFCRERIRFQLERAAGQPAWTQADEDAVLRLLDRIAELFAGYVPEASLLHGDLWSGNAAALVDGRPVIFDPAVYFGDRETDLAMCALFGGFPPAFFSAYQEAWPLAPGYQQRRDLYQLYHVLNHLNLFGGGYAAQARELTGRIWNHVR